MAGKVHLSTWYEDSVLPHDWVIATTENGWTTNEKGLEWIQHFDQHSKRRTSGRYRLLVLDGHESHHSVEFELYCKENNIITLCMPPHSSHILQPLDVGCFSPLKAAYGRQIEKRIRAGTTHVGKEDFFPAFYAAFQEAMTKTNVQGGFRGAGLVPISPERVISRLDVRLRTPTPVDGVPELPEPWVSRTPHNPIEAGSQSEFIKGRIARHQGSSPTSIISALDHFTKGTFGIMHQLALLKSENQILRQENQTLSKRRRAKKTFLRQRGSLTVGEAQDFQAQSQVDAQMREETEFVGDRTRGVKTRQRRCGVCGKPGHNARTCSEETKLSEKDGFD